MCLVFGHLGEHHDTKLLITFDQAVRGAEQPRVISDQVVRQPHHQQCGARQRPVTGDHSPLGGSGAHQHPPLPLNKTLVLTVTF